MPKVVVFDLDDTLYLERDFMFSGFRAVDSWVRRELGLKGFADIAMAEFTGGTRGKIFNAVLKSLACECTPALIDNLVQVYREHMPELRLLPDAEECLAHCGQKHATALITDGHHRTQANKVAALKLGGIVRQIVYSDLLGREFWKPHAAPYEAVMRAVPRAEEFLYIGDNPHKDFITARKLGWKTVRIRRPEGLHATTTLAPEFEADLELADLSSLGKLGL